MDEYKHKRKDLKKRKREAMNRGFDSSTERKLTTQAFKRESRSLKRSEKNKIKIKIKEESENKVEDFIEYTDNGDNYKKPERHFENENIEIRLYCDYHECEPFEECVPGCCNVYIKGVEGYNGGFVAETGQFADLRNQSFVCSKHRNKRIKLSDKKRPRSSTG